MTADIQDRHLAHEVADVHMSHRVTLTGTHVRISEAAIVEQTIASRQTVTGIVTTTTDIRTEDTSAADHALPDAVRRRSRIADALHHPPFQLQILKLNWISSHARSKR